MPYSNIQEARDKVKGLKNKSDKAVREFITIFNSLLKEDVPEDQAIAIALSKVTKHTLKSYNSFANRIYNDFYTYRSRNSVDRDEYPYPVDFDDKHLYFSYEGCLYRIEYKIINMKFQFDQSTVKEVIQETKYIPILVDEEEEELLRRNPKVYDEKMLKAIRDFVMKSNNRMTVIKQFDEEEQIAVEPLYAKVDDVDADGECIGEFEMRKMLANINKSIDSGILESHYPHGNKVDFFNIEKVWYNEFECCLGENIVPEGQPLAKVKFNDTEMWEKRKTGELLGLSIGCRCGNKKVVYEYEDGEEE